MSGQAESLSGGVCLSLLAGGDVQMTVSSPGAVRVTQRTHSEQFTARAVISGGFCPENIR